LLQFIAFLADIFEVEVAPKRLVSISEIVYCSVLFIAGPSAMIASVLGGTLPAEIVLRWYRFRQDPVVFLLPCRIQRQPNLAE
jgi:hypothetical protein